MKFAVKLLSRSDLTFFESQFRQQNAGNQKSINLNADVFVDTIFPVARDIAAGLPRQFPTPVRIYGPGMRTSQHEVMRKVIAKGGSQKNWRLNGEFVYDPTDEPTRYNALAENDLAVLGFEGESVPTAVYIVLASQSEASDADVIRLLRPFVPRRRQSMAVLSPEELRTISDASPEGHPIRELLETNRDEALEEAALGSAAGVSRLLREPSPRRMSLEAFLRARERALATGREGEEFVYVWLLDLLSQKTISEVQWIADAVPLNPWDFEVVENGGERVRIEVKATRGGFDRAVHISQAEILAAADPSAPRTDLYRVYSLTSEGALLRICRDLRPVAAWIARTATALGDGIEPDGYSVAVDRFPAWSDEIELKPEQDESD